MTLTEARERSGMKVPQLAKRLGISKQHLYDIEKGERSPGRELAVRIVEEFPSVDLLGLLKGQQEAR
jgi:DNA-binding XRE family transcriptional regulator